MRIRKSFVASIGLSVLILAFSAVSFQTVRAIPTLDIDTFETAQAQISLTSPGDTGTSTSSFVSGAGILGTERDLQVTLTAASNPGEGVASDTLGGRFSYAQDPNVTASGQLQYDGVDGSMALDPTGLGGVDLTNAGRNNAFEILIPFDDNPIDLTFDVYTDAGNTSTYTFDPGGGIFTTPETFIIPFADFSTAAGTGADFSNVGAVTVTLESAGNAPDFTLDFFNTTSTVGAVKIDALINDVNSNGLVDRGDTLRYTITGENVDDEIDAVADNVVFTDAPDPNTTLIVGSVTTTQGSVTSGNTAGDTTVTVDVGTLPDNTSVTITYDVIVDNAPVGITEVTNQGFLASGTVSDVPTDDSDTPEEDDETDTPITERPVGQIATPTCTDVLESSGSNFGTIALDVTNGTFTTPITLNLSYGGTATRGQDYTAQDTVTFMCDGSGCSTGGTYTLDALTVLDDSIVEASPETVTITFTSVNNSDVTLPAAPLTCAIIDDDEESDTPPTSQPPGEEQPLQPEDLGITQLPSTGETPFWAAFLHELLNQ